tara:strand:+ start:645 stop:1853 length:1209 start_codon:yes stop_codon:yes gene_type:complete
MANIRTRNQLDIFNALDERFNEMGLTYDGYDSFRNILSDIVSSELFSLNNEFYNRFQDLQLSNANGEALDEVANDLFNLTRLPAAKASSSIPEQNVSFYLNIDGTASTEIVIPAGTKISTLDSFEEEDAFFTTVDEATILVGESEVFVNVIAKDAGSVFNVGRERLVYWHDENLDNVNLSCKNNFPIVNGADLESDRNFRIRCSSYIESSIAKNSDFINKTIYEVPGVLEAIQHQGYYGLGTTAYSARGAGRFNNAGFKRIIENRMSQLLRTGESIKIIEDISVFFAIEIEVLSREALNNEAKESLKQEIRNSIEENFISSSNVLNFSNISNLVSNEITSFSFVSSQGSVFKNIKISKSANRYLGENQSSEFKDKLVGNIYTLKSYEIPVVGEIIINVREVV